MDAKGVRGRLCLSRAPGQALLIGECVRIVFRKCARNQVRILVDAPRWLPVMRAELLEPSRPDVESTHS
jgi:sRNA-binding carbon storage regulator CsrA